MKKLVLFIFIFILLFLCAKSTLGFGKKETIIDKINTDSKQQTNEELEINNQDSYYTSTEPIKINTYIFKNKLINSQMLLLNENNNIKDEDFLSKKENFDFNMNTYVLINCNKKKILDVIKTSLVRDNLSFTVEYKESNLDETLLIEMKNIKVKNISYIHLDWE